MLVNGSAHSTLWYEPSKNSVFIIDQTLLPHRFEIIPLTTLEDFCCAITNMQVRGAPLIGITAAFGLAMALSDDASNESVNNAFDKLLATRPTAINLLWALEQVRKSIVKKPESLRANAALQTAEKMRSEDSIICESIGRHGVNILQKLYLSKAKAQEPINILTHCNAGWLATIDWGTALAPIYKAQQAGLPVHVWVDETRPRNQGASLTAWELQQQGISHTVISDNTGGHLMQHGMVDICIVGSDRTTASGDVCNKIGTYLKALAADDNNIPFYVALPSSTIDWTIDDGVSDIPIEQRSPREVTHIQGLNPQGHLTEVQLVANSPACNYAFDVTPARLVSGLITEHGVFSADKHQLGQLKIKLNLI
jgi:methylthioribose-1-phosphate isomerase